MVEKRHELTDGIGRPLDPDPNGSIGLVPHPTGHAELVCELQGRIAEADTLDEPSDDGAAGPGHHGPLVTSSTKRTIASMTKGPATISRSL